VELLGAASTRSVGTETNAVISGLERCLSNDRWRPARDARTHAGWSAAALWHVHASPTKRPDFRHQRQQRQQRHITTQPAAHGYHASGSA